MALPVAGWLAAALIGGFASGIVQGIFKVMISLGIGFAVYSGIDALMDSIALNIISNLNAIDPQIKNILGLMKVDKAINVIVSACGVRLILKGVTNGVFRKLEIRE